MVDCSNEKAAVIVVDHFSLNDSRDYHSQKFVNDNYTWWIRVRQSPHQTSTYIHCDLREDNWALKCEYVVQLLGEGVTPFSYRSDIEFGNKNNCHFLQSWCSSDVKNYISAKDQIVVKVSVKFSAAEVGDPFAAVDEIMYQLPSWTRILLNNPYLSDVEFIVGSTDSQRRFFGHRHVLANASSVFKNMLFPPKEAMATSPTEINMPDVDPTAFMTMLRFVYKKETILDRNKFRQTFVMAQQYGVNGFLSSLKFCLDKESVIDILPLIVEIGRQHILWNKSWDVIKTDIQDITKQEGFLKLPRSVIREILEQDELNIQEIDLWNAYVKWADAQCIAKDAFVNDINRGNIMKDIDLIRFPTMTAEEFASGPAKSNILSPEDKVSIFNYFLTKSNTRFNVNKRKFFFDSLLLLSIFGPKKLSE